MRKAFVSAVVREIQIVAGLVAENAIPLAQERLAALSRTLPPATTGLELGILRHLLLDTASHVPSVKKGPSGTMPTWLAAPGVDSMLEGFLDWMSVREPISAARVIVKRAQAIVEAGLGKPLTSNRVAAVLHCHPRTLERAFASILQTSFKDYVTAVRTDEAIRRIITTDDKTESIAIEVGVRSRVTLRRFVRQRTGMTPALLRQMYRTPQMQARE